MLNKLSLIYLKIGNKIFVPKGLFEILHFYSKSAHYPQTTPSVLKLEGWNFAHRLLILMQKKLPARFLIFV